MMAVPAIPPRSIGSARSRRPCRPNRSSRGASSETFARIGRGGMGVVCEAYQGSLKRHVALKFVPELGDLAGFRREARAAGRLHHTIIIPVFGVGEQQGLPSHEGWGHVAGAGWPDLGAAGPRFGRPPFADLPVILREAECVIELDPAFAADSFAPE
jgi:serine/threonine protein kinase